MDFEFKSRSILAESEWIFLFFSMSASALSVNLIGRSVKKRQTYVYLLHIWIYVALYRVYCVCLCFERRNFESDIPGQISSYILSIVPLFLARQPIFKRAKSISLHLIQTNSKNWLFLHLLERILNESSWHYLNEFKLLLPTVIYEYAYWLKPAISMLHAFKWVHMNTFNVYSLYLYLLVA